MGESHSQLQVPEGSAATVSAIVAAAAAAQQAGVAREDAVKGSLSQHQCLSGNLGAATAPGIAVIAAPASAAAHPNAGLAGDLYSGNQLCEPVLLSQLVQLLSQRPKHTLLLSDLGALLPGPLRHGVKERGGLRSWLHKYQELFKVSGQPGKECVTLLLGSGMDSAMANSTSGGGQNPPVPTSRSSSNDAREDHEQSREESEDNESDVQLRGLPYRASVADVRAFLGHHAQFLRDDRSVRLVLNRDGRASGFAHVLFASPAYAKAARDDLHMRVMDTGSQAESAQERYVEVFLFSERPNKLRFRKTTTGEENPSVPIAQDEPGFPGPAGVSQERVIAECREHMASPGKGQLLLSMLGVALSPVSRMYLKKTDQGLKHFLAQYPHEFRVEGAKGREYITYIPACGAGGQENSDLPAGFTEDCTLPAAHASSSRMRAGAVLNVSGRTVSDSLQPLHLRGDDAKLPQTPQGSGQVGVNETPKNMKTPSCWGTPSNWGTPQIFSSSMQGGGGGSQDAQEGGAANDVQDDDEGNLFGMRDGQDRFGFYGLSEHAAGTQPSHGWPSWNMPVVQWPNPSNMSAGLPGSMDCSFQPHPSWAAAAANGQDGMVNFAAVFAALGGHISASASGPSSSQPAQQAWQQHGPTKSSQAPNLTECSVRLRGLPFTATEQDVLAFFAKHDLVECVADVPNAVTMVTKSSGKPSGQAVVQITNYSDVGLVQQTMHGQYMGSRYVEVFSQPENEQSTSAPLRAHGGGGLPPSPHLPAANPAGASSSPGTFSLQAALAGVGGCLPNRGGASSATATKDVGVPPPESPRKAGEMLLGVGDTGGSGSFAAAPWQQQYWESMPAWAA